MSGATARNGLTRPTARPTVRPTARPAGLRGSGPRPGTTRSVASGRGPTPPPLQVVPSLRHRVARGPFVSMVVAVLAAGLLALLGLNTVLAQGSFRQHALQVQAKQLADREQDLRHQVDALQAPAALAAAAQAQGMVPAGPPAFLRLPDGAVLGEAAPATAPPAPPAPSPAASADPAAGTAPTAKATVPAATAPRVPTSAATAPRVPTPAATAPKVPTPAAARAPATGTARTTGTTLPTAAAR